MNHQQITEEILRDIVASMASRDDPAGSYTGLPIDGSLIPTQDVDDL